MAFGKEIFRITVPGPTPWALSGADARLHTSAGDYTWRSGTHGLAPDHTALVSPTGEWRLFLESMCHVLPLPGTLLLVWNEAGWKDPALRRNDRLEVRLFDLFRLQALDPAQASAGLKGSAHVVHRGGLVAELTIPAGLSAGRHPLRPPRELAEVGELLALADCAPPDPPGKKPWREARAIYAIDLAGGSFEVLPQLWFNEGDFDYPYQWIARVQRDPASGRIHGDGVRLGVFRLDERGTRVEKWLDRRV